MEKTSPALHFCSDLGREAGVGRGVGEVLTWEEPGAAPGEG